MWRCALAFLLGCGSHARTEHDASTGQAPDGALVADASVDGALADAAVLDGNGSNATGLDASVDAPSPPAGIITGGPCMSGAAGATAFRIRWAKSGSTAYVVYEVNGLPDKTDKAGAYGYQIGFQPQYVDPFLAQGGLQLDSSSFIDLELSTVGVASIANATIAIYGRSFNTTASGSFNWRTFEGDGSTPTNFVSNVAPYAWYRADMTTEISPADDGVRIRIKAGPSSGALVVNRIELCMQAT